MIQAAPTPISPGAVNSYFSRDWAWASLPFLVGFLLTYRMVLLHHAQYSLGENGDGIIVIAILEHWLHVFQHGFQDWRTTGFFYPARGTLGLTDTFFIDAVPYVGGRILGFGPFAAFTASVAMLSTIGYWGMYVLCRRWLAAAAPFAAGAAYILAFGAMPVWKLLHVQTYTIMLAPCLCLLILYGWRVSRPSRQLLLGGCAGLLSGLIVFSAAQTAWFICFTGGITAGIWLILERPHFTRMLLLKRWPLAAGLLAGLLITSVPVLAVYLSMAGSSTREFAEVLVYSPHASDLIHVPPGTPLWSDLLHSIGLSPDTGVPIAELALGYTPAFLMTVLMAGLAFIGRARSNDRTTAADRVALACIIGPLLTWALQLTYTKAHWHPWLAVFTWVPGARAIRTPFRAQLVGQFLMCLAFAHLLTRHFGNARPSNLPATSDAPQAARVNSILLLLGFGFALSLVEQVGPGPIVRQNAELAGWLSVAHRPPFPCDAFYLMPDPTSPEPFWRRQSNAMLLSEWLDFPTLNGSSSWVPPGWDLMHPEAPDYSAKVQQWIVSNHLQGKVCSADPRTGRWFAGDAADGEVPR